MAAFSSADFLQAQYNCLQQLQRARNEIRAVNYRRDIEAEKARHAASLSEAIEQNNDDLREHNRLSYVARDEAFSNLSEKHDLAIDEMKAKLSAALQCGEDAKKEIEDSNERNLNLKNSMKASIKSIQLQHAQETYILTKNFGASNPVSDRSAKTGLQQGKNSR
jgi:hypothetical protein